MAPIDRPAASSGPAPALTAGKPTDRDVPLLLNWKATDRRRAGDRPVMPSGKQDDAAARNIPERMSGSFHYEYPRWALRSWFGMQFSAWLGLLLRNRFAITPRRLPTAILVTFASIVNSLLALLQALVFGRRIGRTKFASNPIFIIGHWRSGTTFLHELLALDDRFVWPTTYECLAPSHFLLSGRLARLLQWFLPERRPMDGMRLGVDRPQEDEWAILALGLGSPYETIAFPNHRPVRHEFLDLREIDSAQLRRWQDGLWRFLQSVQLRRDRAAGTPWPVPPQTRFVLKSPPHTARIWLLRRMFPQACFIHLVREPVELFSSTCRLWTTLFDVYGCQKPYFHDLPGGGPNLGEYVLTTLERLYRRFDEDTRDLPPHRFCELRFEDLTRWPLAEMERLYGQLDLGSFAAVRDRVEAYLARVDYGASDHRVMPGHVAEIARRWPAYGSRFRSLTAALTRPGDAKSDGRATSVARP